jgi:hypothetical protein
MTDRIPRTEPAHVLADVKARPRGWPPASLDPGSGRGPQGDERDAGHEDHKIRSLRFQGIAG